MADSSLYFSGVVLFLNSGLDAAHNAVAFFSILSNTSSSIITCAILIFTASSMQVNNISLLINIFIFYFLVTLIKYLLNSFIDSKNLAQACNSVLAMMLFLRDSVLLRVILLPTTV